MFEWAVWSVWLAWVSNWKECAVHGDSRLQRHLPELMVLTVHIVLYQGSPLQLVPRVWFYNNPPYFLEMVLCLWCFYGDFFVLFCLFFVCWFSLKKYVDGILSRYGISIEILPSYNPIIYWLESSWKILKIQMEIKEN